MMMRKKMFYIAGILTALFLFAGCEEMQEGIPTDVTFVPIDEISVEEDIDVPPMPELDEDLPISTIDEVEELDELDEPEEMDELEELDEGAVAELVIKDEPEEEVLEEELTEEDIEDLLEEVEVEMIDEPEEELDEIEEITEEDIELLEDSPVEREIVIIVQETDLVNLQPVAYDPDEDKLQFSYSTPLDESGKWKTTYGDMGEYTISITASDGELSSSKDALLIVNKKEEAPTVDTYVPEEMTLTMDENTELSFQREASDLNSDPLSYLWKLDGEEVSINDVFDYEADYFSAGSHTVKVDVSDGISVVSLLWSVTVDNVDRAPILKVIPDITIKETETIVITPEASDPDGDEIQYTVSEPVENDGLWETSYDDSGVYRIKVIASDGELEDSQEVKVTVINVNRPPVIENIVQVE